MINKVKGTVTEIDEKIITLTIFGVISLEIFVSCSNQFSIGEEYTVFVYMSFGSEKGYVLYGFLDKIEKIYFLLLQDCHGIGAKLALQILSKLSIEKIYTAILEENKVIFETISGIGKKKAEMMIIELKSKVSKLSVVSVNPMDSVCLDLENSLEALGYNKKEVAYMMQSVYRLISEKNVSLDLLIKEAIKNKISLV